MIWSVRRDHPEGDMTPLAVMLSSLVASLRELLVCSSIKRPDKSVILKIRGDKNQRNIIAQRTLREALKLWRLVQF